MKALNFPQDELVHKYIIEWWYHNGHLWDEAGNHYAYMHCLFRADNKKVGIPLIGAIPLKEIYFSHSIISDISKKKSYPVVNYLSVMSTDSFTKPLLFVNYFNYNNPLIFKNYFNCSIEEKELFNYQIKTEDLSLNLQAVKEPLLVGGDGYVNVHSKKSYYYSITNLKTEGTIKINNKEIKVKGKSWIDRQWANVKYTKDKWTWFSIQLNNNLEMVCYEYDDGQVKSYMASLSYPDGSVRHTDKIIFTPMGSSWQSRKTKASYPINWRIDVPELKIKLEVRPLIKDQEVVFGLINYWEGPLAVSGEIGGVKVSGYGFSELLGRPAKIGNLKFLHKVIAEQGKSLYKQLIK